MKGFVFLSLAVIFFSCSKEEPAKIETFSTEAFVFDLGDSWEVNATTRVKGFNQKEEGDNFSATIVFDLDLVTPEGDTIKSLISRVEDKTEKERINDIPLEVQFELDSTYAAGDYTIIFNVKDAVTEQISISTTAFQLVNE